MNGNAEQRQQTVARGFRFVAAVVVIGVILAAGEGALTEPMTHTLHDTAAAQAAPVPSSDYFPSGYTLNASEPEPPIEQF
jgi:hypothetical protein